MLKYVNFPIHIAVIFKHHINKIGKTWHLFKVAYIS